LREAVRDVLGDPVYRGTARRLAAEMAALPGPDHAVTLLERLVTTGAPVFAESEMAP
jgi:UDP:flavonoid glycosyltransferase YjiC (YdhE family)